jgi:CubicO group peptidase (beta-lactamase class C family)
MDVGDVKYRSTSSDPRDLRIADRIDEIVEQFVADGKAPGVVLKVLQDGRTLYERTVGERDVASHAPMRPDNRFALASMSKPFTSVAIMQLVDQGKIRLEDSVATVLPQFAKMAVHGGDGVPVGEQITFHQLLTHTSGLSYGAIKVPGSGNVVSDMYFDAEILYHRVVRGKPEGASKTLEEMVDRLVDMPLAYEPGTSWEYSIASDVLARVVEVLSGERFDRYLSKYLFEPIGMTRTNYFCSDRSQIATNYDVGAGGELVANDVSERHVDEPTFFGGGGELITTAEDYACFDQMLLNGGTLGDNRVLSQTSVAQMTRNHLSDAQRNELNKVTGGTMLNYGFGYGFAVAIEPDAAAGVAKGDYFWNGGGGTVNWVDPENRVVGVIMKHVRFDLDLKIAQDIRKAITAS